LVIYFTNLRTCIFIATILSKYNKRLTKTAKMYFMDTGLAAYLAGWTTPEALEIGIAAGAFFEIFVVGEII
jgi:predicted AAA+ superfamily ATPase